MEAVKKIYMKIRSFLEREMTVTLLAWLIILLVVAVIKIFGLGKMK